MYQMVLLTAFFACLLPLGVKWPTAEDALAMVGSGVMNGVGQYWWTRALHLAPASAVSPFYYFMLVWAVILGFLFWGDVPTLGLLVGSSIVVGSGLFLLWRESGAADARSPRAGVRDRDARPRALLILVLNPKFAHTVRHMRSRTSGSRSARPQSC
jgi:drug/metabolite transporter (DMT)-like permease